MSEIPRIFLSEFHRELRAAVRGPSGNGMASR